MKHLKLHAKMMLADGKRAIVGSINLAPGSFDGRRELAIESDHHATVQRLADTAQRDWEASHKIDLSDAGLIRDLAKRQLDTSHLVLDPNAVAEPKAKKHKDKAGGWAMTHPILRALRALASIACAALLATVACAKEDAAEFAIRWDPAAGGPRTVEEVAQALQLREGSTRNFVVRYFAVNVPRGTPEGATAIARERLSDDRLVSMYKVRHASPLPAASRRAGWQCPFTADAAREREVDIGWTAEGLPTRTYSISCEAEGPLAELLPAGAATPRGCTSNVLRLTAQRIKVERWSLPDGTLTLEVSSNGRDNEAQLEAFATRVVRPLLALGAKPIAQSKTQLGSCAPTRR
jgi:hypothetical protein